MRALNRRVEVDGVPVAVVAHDALVTLGLLGRTSATSAASRPGAREDVFALYHRAAIDASRDSRCDISSLSSSRCSWPFSSPCRSASFSSASRGRAEAVIRGVGVLQTIPGIALLAFMIPLLGIGAVPALAALVLYSLYPIVRNTYTGVRDADPAAVSAARALGMTEGQILRQVRLPLAAPVIMAGIRTAAVIDVGTATLAAFIGAGGLGEPIVAGLALSDTRMILSGAIPAALLAIAVDAGLAHRGTQSPTRSLMTRLQYSHYRARGGATANVAAHRAALRRGRADPARSSDEPDHLGSGTHRALRGALAAAQSRGAGGVWRDAGHLQPVRESAAGSRRARSSIARPNAAR